MNKDQNSQTGSQSAGLTCYASEMQYRPGACVDIPPHETTYQLNNDIVWINCLFCWRSVLVQMREHKHEVCKCGARRITIAGRICWAKDNRWKETNFKNKYITRTNKFVAL